VLDLILFGRLSHDFDAVTEGVLPPGFSPYRARDLRDLLDEHFREIRLAWASLGAPLRPFDLRVKAIRLAAIEGESLPVRETDTTTNFPSMSAGTSPNRGLRAART
jgi:hypothetical protein